MTIILIVSSRSMLLLKKVLLPMQHKFISDARSRIQVIQCHDVIVFKTVRLQFTHHLQNRLRNLLVIQQRFQIDAFLMNKPSVFECIGVDGRRKRIEISGFSNENIFSGLCNDSISPRSVADQNSKNNIYSIYVHDFSAWL